MSTKFMLNENTQEMYDWRKRLLESKLGSTSPGYRIGNRTIRFQPQCLWLLALLSVIIFFIYYVRPSTATDRSSSLNNINNNGQIVVPYNPIYPLTSPIISNGIINFKIAVIADLDTNSRVNTKDEWKSYLKRGFFSWNERQESVAINWDEEDKVELISHYSHKGRGMELSELLVFNGRLLTVDDRTGIIFEIIKDKMIPWVILTDGDGISPKGFKSEWATVKDEHLWVGSMGKEWTSSNGEYLNDDPMFVKRISTNGYIESINWEKNYKNLRKAIGIEFPGYLIFESGAWSDEHKKWFFLPRRCSKDKYDEAADEHRGCNILVTADADFTKINKLTIGSLTPTLGYSSFKFVPNTKDQVIVALKSEEVDGKTATYITVFKIDGKILLPDQKISSTLKYEGLEFI